jgi:hypothetical protein
MNASGSRRILLHMFNIELIPERRADGSVVLRAVTLGPIERLRRRLRRLARGA